MGRFRKVVQLLCAFTVIAIASLVASSNCPAEQIKFTDWVGVEEMDPAINKKSRQIGTFAKDGISSLWLARPEAGEDRILLTLKSKKKIASEYYSYRIDRVDTLVIRSAIRACESNCLEDFVSGNGELIKTMKRGLRIEFEYDSEADTALKPTFSLRGFSRAYSWLLSK